MMQRVVRSLAFGLAVLAISGCRSLGSSCHEPKEYAAAGSVAPLKVPAGLESPDTRNALRVPELNSPEPPPRKKGDACLDEPPTYTTAPKPAPSA